MTVSQAPELELPAMFHGLTGAILRAVRAKGRAWGREYFETGVFTPTRRMLRVPLGESLFVDSGADSNLVPVPRWRIHLFSDVFTGLSASVPKDKHPALEEAFESFCLGTPWGALYYVVSPPPPWSAERSARRFAALLRFWHVLQGPRYALWFERQSTLDELVRDLHGVTLDAWVPERTASGREHLALAVERMARATREECLEAVLRVMPVLIQTDKGFKHREALLEPGFLREHLVALSPENFAKLSGANRHTVTMQLADWDRALGRR